MVFSVKGEVILTSRPRDVGETCSGESAMNSSDFRWIAATAVVVALGGFTAVRYFQPQELIKGDEKAMAEATGLGQSPSPDSLSDIPRQFSTGDEKAATASTNDASPVQESTAAVSTEPARTSSHAATFEPSTLYALQGELEQMRAEASLNALPEEPMPADPIRIPQEIEQALKRAQTSTANKDLQRNREANAHRSPSSSHIEDSLRQQLIDEPEARFMNFSVRCSYSTCELRVTILPESRESNGSELVQGMVRRVLARPEFQSNISPGSQQSAAGILEGGGYHQVWNWRLIPY